MRLMKALRFWIACILADVCSVYFPDMVSGDIGVDRPGSWDPESFVGCCCLFVCLLLSLSIYQRSFDSFPVSCPFGLSCSDEDDDVHDQARALTRMLRPHTYYGITAYFFFRLCVLFVCDVFFCVLCMWCCCWILKVSNWDLCRLGLGSSDILPVR